MTGASRGIGRASAIALARAGFDVAVSARTVKEGDSRLPDGRAVPGSLESTVAEIEAAGRAGFAVPMDMLDHGSLVDGVAKVLDRFGRIDVLLNNAIYQGPGSMTPFLDLADDEMRRMFEGNVYAQLTVIREVIPAMVAQGGGVIMNMISATAHVTPPGKIGAGGWGMAYAMTKAAFERVAPLLCVEHGDAGIVAYSLDPGYVLTERAAMNDSGGRHSDHFTPAGPEVIGAAVAWLATDDAAPAEYGGRIVFAQREALKRGLIPDWRPKS